MNATRTPKSKPRISRITRMRRSFQPERSKQIIRQSLRPKPFFIRVIRAIRGSLLRFSGSMRFVMLKKRAVARALCWRRMTSRVRLIVS